MTRRVSEKVAYGLLLLLAGLVGPQSAAGDDLADAIKKTESTSQRLIDGQKKDRSRDELKSALNYDQLSAVLNKGKAARKAEVVAIRDHYISALPELTKKYRLLAEQTRQGLESWVEALPSLNLQQILTKLKSNPPKYVALTSQQVSTRRQALDAAVEKLTSYLDTKGGEFDWNSQIHWDGLLTELAKTDPSLAILDRSLKGFFGPDVEGLEQSEFIQLRVTLRAYMNAIYFTKNAKSEQMFEVQIARLAESLTSYLKTPSNENAWKIGRTIGWLERAEQASDLRNEVRYYFYQPNILVHISQHLISSGEKRIVDQTQDVEQVVKGVPVKGVATMKGQVSFALAENSQRATINVMMDGTILSKNVAEKSGVTVKTNGTTTVHAEKRISFDKNGFADSPAIAKATTKLELDSIEAPSSTYESIAKTKFIKGRSDNEEAASQLSVDSVTKEMDTNVLEMLSDVIDGYKTKVRDPLLRRGGFPEQFTTSSTKESVNLQLLQIGRYQLAAFSEPPTLNKNTDVSLRLHESFVRNFTEVVLGGVELTDEKLVEHMTRFGAEIPDELKIGPGKKSWAITFSNTQPISVEFRNNQIVIAIQGQQFLDGKRLITEPIRIAATYNVEKTKTGMRLQRDGDVAVDFLARKTLTVVQVATKTVMSKKFNALFKDDIVGQGGIKLPGQWENAENLILQQLIADNGWLMLSYNLGKPSE
ncbi:MAG: hypothetical protein HOB73_06905 [Planctomycetaceae bacterium]|nr:hypothetical protein [Planctomycetaceae bacterium]